MTGYSWRIGTRIWWVLALKLWPRVKNGEQRPKGGERNAGRWWGRVSGGY